MCRKRVTFAQNFENCAMNDIPSFNSYIENTIKDNWLLDALTDYKSTTLQYHDVARKIEKLHIMMEAAGIQKGDRIAVCGRNSAHWSVAFLATLTYGAVIVPILHEFNAEQIHNIVNHSESRLLFVGDYVAPTIDAAEMPHLEGIFNLPDFSLHTSRNEQLTDARERLNELFGHKFPNAYRQKDIHWHQDKPEELCMINYTSGTTGFSKGVMLPYRALWQRSSQTRPVSRMIMRRGVLLIAANPTGMSRPGLVTRPTPSPPSMKTRGLIQSGSVPSGSGSMPASASAARFRAATVSGSEKRTSAQTRIPSVMSTSSPPSFRTAQEAPCSSKRGSSITGE